MNSTRGMGLTGAAALALLVAALPATAVGQDRFGVPGARQADLHNPNSPHHVDFRPGGLQRRTAAGQTGGASRRPVNQVTVIAPTFGSGCGARCRCNRCFDPCFYTPWTVYGCFPFYASPTSLNGPFVAYYRGYYFSQQTPVAPAPIVRRELPRPADALPDGVVARERVNATGARTHELARRYVSYGDKHFAEGRYGEADSRYRRAMKIAPDVADAYFRHGQALIALERYDAAAVAMKQGMELQPDWARSPFRLHELYRERAAERVAHTEALRAAHQQDVGDGDLAFLLAWQLYYDGRREASREYFERAFAQSFYKDHLKPFVDFFAAQDEARDEPPARMAAAAPQPRMPGGPRHDDVPPADIPDDIPQAEPPRGREL